MKKLENKVAVITGGSGSIGKNVAKLFLAEGAKVVLVDLSETELKKVVEELNSPQVKYCVADVSKASEVKHYVNETVQWFGKIDVFFNNAGIEGVVIPLTEYPEDAFDKVLSVNVKGVWLGMKYTLPEMQDGGSVILTSSVAGLMAFPNLSAYVISKHAIVGLMRVAAMEAAPRKIRVNSIHPGPVNNGMMRSIEEGMSVGHSKEAQNQFEAAIPFGRYAEPLEVANLVLFLASDASQYITGTTQVIDGGMCAH